MSKMSARLPTPRSSLTKENLEAWSRTNSFRGTERDIEDPASTRSTLYKRSRKHRKLRINAQGSITSNSSDTSELLGEVFEGRGADDTWTSFNSDKAHPPRYPLLTLTAGKGAFAAAAGWLCGCIQFQTDPALVAPRIAEPN